MALALAATVGCKSGGPGTGDGSCPTPERPYLHLDNADCLQRIPAPRITDVSIAPFGGKVPIEVTFRATAAPPYPELAEGMRLVWDVDGTPGQDAEVGAAEPLAFRYDACGNVPISVTAVDRFGRASAANERVIINRCNQPPEITLFIATRSGSPNSAPIGNVGTSIRFTIQAVDPDADDPTLAEANGIRNFQIDWEGDGVFDDTFDGILQLLPRDHVYDRVGIFRPILRAYDAEGDYGEAGPLLVSIFAQSAARGRLRLDGTATAVAPTPVDAGRNAATSAAFGWGPAGWGLVERTGAERLQITVNEQRNYEPGSSEEDVRALAWVPAVGMLAAGGARGVDVWQRGSESAWDWSALRRYNCLPPSTLVWQRVAAADLPQGGRATALVAASGRLQIRRGPLLESGDLANPGWCTLAARFGALVDAAASAGPAPLGTLAVRDAAVAGQYVWAIGDDGAAGALLVWRLDGSPSLTAATALCGTWPAACPGSIARRPTALAVDGGGVVSQVVDGREGATIWALARAVTSAAGAALQVGAVTRPVGSGWSFDGSAPWTRITVDATTATELATAGHGLLSAAVEPLVALGWSDGELALAPWSDAGTAPVLGGFVTASTNRRVDRLAIAGHVVAWADAGSPVTTIADPDTGLRQPRGVYAAPLSAPARWSQIAADDQAAREADGLWSGPLDLRAYGPWLWAAEGSRGIRAMNATALVAGTWASAPTVWTDGVGATLRTDVQGRIGDTRPSSELLPRRGSMAADKDSGEAWLALGAAGVAHVKVQETWSGGVLASAVAGLADVQPSTAPARGVAILPADSAGPTRLIVAESRCGRATCATPDGRLSTFAPVGVGAVAAVAIDAADGFPVHVAAGRSLDAGDGLRAVALVGRLLPSAATVWDVRGVLGDGSFDGRRWEVPAALTSHLFDTSPPLLANLNPAGGRVRSLFLDGSSGSYDRICIEPLWGGACTSPGSSLGLVGVPLPLVSNGRRYVVQIESNLFFRFRNAETNELLPTSWHPCLDLPVEERELCAIGFKVYDAWPADPYWLLSTNHALFVVDVRDPGRPFVATRQLQCNRIAATTPGHTCALGDWDIVTGWTHPPIGGVRALLRHNPGAALQVIDVPDLFTPTP